MRTKCLLVSVLLLFAATDWSEAGGRGWRGGHGWHGGGWHGGGWHGGGWHGSGWRGGRGYWGGGPYWRGGWGWGRGWGWGPTFGVGFVAPLPVYRTVYVRRPAPIVAYSGSILFRAQVRLTRLGYSPGPIDGDFGPRTSRAIRDYQIDNGLPVTGRLDFPTRESLGV